MSSARIINTLTSHLSRALTHEAASTSSSISQTLSNLSLRAAAAASARFESTLVPAAQVPTTPHPYTPPKTGGLLVDTLDIVSSLDNNRVPSIAFDIDWSCWQNLNIAFFIANSFNLWFIPAFSLQMRKFEQAGMSREQAENLTATLTEVICTNRDRMSEYYVSKAALERSELEASASIAGFRAEVLKSQELHVATFTRDAERLQVNIEKLRSEIRYEIDKLTASQRLDLNLEKGRMRDELQALRDRANEMEIKIDKEVNSLKAAMEQSKNDTVKYVLGLMLALLTAGLGAARLVMH